MKHHPPIQLLRLFNCPIFRQLQIEEALLRADTRNWCIINSGSPPAIVMGISAKPALLLNSSLLAQKPVPVIRRFSGGGTVFIDQQTCLVTLICNSLQIGVPCYPDKVMQWTESLYKHVFPNIDFRLLENDYVFGHKKFGGNAQYMCKERWLHHSSLLWDFQEENMHYLLPPARMPQYRQKRQHSDFLCRIREHMDTQEELLERIIGGVEHTFSIQKVVMEHEVTAIEALPHRKATILVDVTEQNALDHT